MTSRLQELLGVVAGDFSLAGVVWSGSRRLLVSSGWLASGDDVAGSL